MALDMTRDYRELESRLDLEFKKNPTFRRALSNFANVYLCRLYTLDAIDRGSVKCDLPSMKKYFVDLFKGLKNDLTSILSS